MASNDFKMMYKSKLKECNSTANRRKSRGLERQKLRDDEVNRRRLLSNMSPVSEDINMFDIHEEKKGLKGTHEKALNRQERLKQWREDRKRKQEEARKNANKPMFKVSHLQHKDDLQIYNIKELKEVQKTEDKKAIPKPALTQNIVPKETKKVESKEPNTDRKTRSVVKATKFEDKEEINVERKTRSGANKAKLDNHAVMNIEKKTRPVGKTARVDEGANMERKTRSVVKANKAHKVAVGKKEKDQPELKKNPNQAQIKTSALYCKPTAAAAAKSTNEKHTNFLRAKSRQAVVNKPKPHTKAAQDKVSELEHEIAPEPKNVTPERKKSVRLNTRVFSIDSESEKDLHLSDSAVSTPKHSTPRPARSSNGFKSSGSRKRYKKTPAIKRVKDILRNKDTKSVRDISPIKKDVNKKEKSQQENSESENSEKEASDSEQEIKETSPADSEHEIKETSPEKKSLNISNISDKENIHVASPRLMRSALKKSSVEEKSSSSENEALQDAEVFAQKFTPKLKLSNLEPSVTPSSGKNRKTRAQLDSSVKSSPAKRQRSAVISPSNDQEDGERNSVRSAKRARFTSLKSSSSDEEILNVITHEVQEPDPDLPADEVSSAFRTRKSLRLAGLYSDNDIANNPEKKLTTPRNRKSLLASKRKSRSRHRSQSVVVSVSDEGTTGALGDNIIGEIHPTPEHHHKMSDIACMNSSASPKVRSKQSELIDVSDEGTSLMSEQNPSVVYQVIKSEGSSRALQELTVAKIDGEISFIEVPLEDSIVLPRISHSSENSTLSTQPFSPTVSNDISGSSSNLSPKAAPPQAVSGQASDNQSLTTQGTPPSFKSLRRRAYSIAPVFKTPSVSKAAKNERRRRKTDHLLKSPEEMIAILSKSPMVEMTRRKSKFIHSSDNAEKETESSSSEVEAIEVVQQQGSKLPSDTSTSEEKLDKVKHYRQLVISESQKLNELCDKWTDYLKEHCDIPEEAQGQILSTVGKTQLLMDQKFKQFSGLINDCEFNLGENVVNPTDLQGFWEMIYYQVEDVVKLFSKLSDLEKDNWQVKQPSPKKVLKKKVIARTSKPRVKSNFAAFRQEMIKRKTNDPTLNTSIDMATVDSDKNKVFDAGFFKVSSPVRSYGGSKKSTPVMAVTEDNSSPQREHSGSNSGSPLIDVASTPSSSNKENKIAATPLNRLLSATRKSYAPAVPSPLLNDITGLKTKK